LYGTLKLKNNFFKNLANLKHSKNKKKLFSEKLKFDPALERDTVAGLVGLLFT